MKNSGKWRSKSRSLWHGSKWLVHSRKMRNSFTIYKQHPFLMSVVLLWPHLNVKHPKIIMRKIIINFSKMKFINNRRKKYCLRAYKWPKIDTISIFFNVIECICLYLYLLLPPPAHILIFWMFNFYNRDDKSISLKRKKN